MNQSGDFQIEEAFNLYDKEGKGFITCDLLGIVLRSVGKIPSQKEIKSIAAKWNKNHGGKISLKDLKQIASQITRKVTDDQIRAAYKVFDRDNKGYINVKELAHILTTVGEKLSIDDVKSMLKQANVGNDGKITPDQFGKIMKGVF